MNIKAKYPSEDECFTIIHKYEMLPNIVDHSVQVKNVSIAIYEHLKSKDIISRELLVAAALLHDIAKTRSIKNREMRHDLIGLTNNLHIAILNAVMHHLDIVTSASLSNPIAAWLTIIRFCSNALKNWL